MVPGLLPMGVSGVGGEVHDNLVNLRSVQGDGRKIGIEGGLDLDSSGDGGANELESFLDDWLRRLRLALLILGTAKRRDATDEIRGSGTGLGDFRQILLNG
jgi:hypothetical protein